MKDLTRRALIGAVAAGGLTASSTVASGAAPAAGIDIRAVNPELRPAVEAMMKQFGSMPDVSAATLSAMRKMMGGMSAPPAPSPVVIKRVVPGVAGRPDVPVWIINGRPGGTRPIIVHTHGGGFVMGDAASGIGALQPIATALDCVIITVDYRIAPETRWAGSTEDNYAALKWVHDRAADLGADPARIAVMGESAGGGHAALLAIIARDRGEVPLVFQSLTYPMLDDRTGSTVTPPAPVGRMGWTAPSNRYGWQAFLGQLPGTDRVPAAAVPARVIDVKGLPPAWIGVGSIDLFVDEDVTYARRLFDAGIPTELTVVPGAFHGFDIMAPQTTVVKRFAESRLAALRQAFGGTKA